MDLRTLLQIQVSDDNEYLKLLKKTLSPQEYKKVKQKYYNALRYGTPYDFEEITIREHEKIKEIKGY